VTRTVLAVVGARPNFVKVAPVLHALAARPAVRVRLLHTGQHYDPSLSEVFIGELGLPPPEFHLGVGSGSHAEQTAAVLVGVERVLADHRPDAVMVAGDVNSTLGAALAAAKAETAIVHVESGLRSRDWTMPEEVNRVVTDRVSHLLLCHSQEAVDNLAAEGITGDRVRLVGNTMIDSLFSALPEARGRGALERYGLEAGAFVLVTLHRPGVVDDPQRLAAVLAVLAELSRSLPVVFPLHPRTRARLRQGDLPRLPGLRLMEPLDYLDFIALEADATLVITDSGGIQEETSALGVPCLTYRTTTERPITVEVGTNRVVGVEPAALMEACREELAKAPARERRAIPLWDGQAGPRAADAVVEMLTGPWPPPPPIL
jgi:UDP-N-acetylglucosamine 2-epimerase (non-hydrolysing)